MHAFRNGAAIGDRPFRRGGGCRLLAVTALTLLAFGGGASAAAAAITVAFSPSAPTTTDAVTVTVTATGCGAGNLLLPTLTYAITGPVNRSGTLATPVLSNGGDTATATVTLTAGTFTAGAYAVLGVGTGTCFGLLTGTAASPMTVTSVTVPGAPTSVNAVVGNASATVSWSAPVSVGGSAITGYTVTASPGAKTCAWTSGPLNCAVVGLTNGTSYTFTATATNAIGTSAASVASMAVTLGSASSSGGTSTPAVESGSPGGSAGIRTAGGGTITLAPPPTAYALPSPVAPQSSVPAAAPGSNETAVAPPPASATLARGGRLTFGLEQKLSTRTTYSVRRNGTRVWKGTAARGVIVLAPKLFSKAKPVVFTLLAAEGKGERQILKVTVTYKKRPAKTPTAQQGWAWKMLAWRTAPASPRAARPAGAPKTLPAWWWKWADWQQRPFALRYSR